MPPILDAAIGTFFVFMLFSIAVTALNEVVLTFFDKRADFLRLGLGELLGDSQKYNQQGYVNKLIQFGSEKLDWVIAWALSLPLFAWSAGADGETMTLFGIIMLAALTRLGWFYAERRSKEKSDELDQMQGSGNDAMVVTMQAKVQEHAEQLERKKTQFRTITIAGILIAVFMAFMVGTGLFKAFAVLVAFMLFFWLFFGYAWLLVGFTSLWAWLKGLIKPLLAKGHAKSPKSEGYDKQQGLNKFAKDRQDSLHAVAAEWWRELLADVKQLPQKQAAAPQEIIKIETESAEKLAKLQETLGAAQAALATLTAQKTGADTAKLQELEESEKLKQKEIETSSVEIQEITSERDAALKKLRESLLLTPEQLRTQKQEALQTKASMLQGEIDKHFNDEQAILSANDSTTCLLKKPSLSIPVLSLDPDKPPVVPLTITVKDVFTHPLIFSLSKGDSDPSYIGSEAFSKALLDILVPAVDKPLTKEAIQESIQNLANERLKTSLAVLNRSVQGELEPFKKALEDWFNLSMQRVSGWYKRHAQTWLIILAFVLAVVCNVDSIRIIQELSNSPNLARAISAQAESYVKTTGPALTGEDLTKAIDDQEKLINEARRQLTQDEAALESVVKVAAQPANELVAALAAANKHASDLAALRKTMADPTAPDFSKAKKTSEDLDLSMASADKLAKELAIALPLPARPPTNDSGTTPQLTLAIALTAAEKAMEDLDSTLKKVQKPAETFAKARQAVADAEQKVTDARRSHPALLISPEAQRLIRERKDAKIAAAKELKNNAKTDEEKAEAEKKLDEAIAWEETLAQFQGSLKALSTTGIPMGWDEKTKRLFNILKTPSETKNSVPPEEKAEAKSRKDEAEQEARESPWSKSAKQVWTWIRQPYTWLETNVHRPKDWNWGVLFPALCGWALTALAASLGAPFWFDILQRIMNIRANGRSPDEKDLGTKKPDQNAANLSHSAQPATTGATSVSG